MYTNRLNNYFIQDGRGSCDCAFLTAAETAYVNRLSVTVYGSSHRSSASVYWLIYMYTDNGKVLCSPPYEIINSPA